MATVASQNETTTQTARKVSRPHGKNISKLMRFFDSSVQKTTSNVLNEDCCETSEGMVNRTNSDIAQESSVETSAHVLEFSTADNSSLEMSQRSPTASFSESSPVYQNATDISLLEKSSVKNEIPYCRKVSKNGLWDNANVTSNDNQPDQSISNLNSSDVLQTVDPYIATTADLNNLIATSRAELSKMKDPSISGKSKLESYFTSFETKETQGHSVELKNSHEILNNGFFNPFFPSYGCDKSEMNFEEDIVLSDESSDEDLTFHPSLTNTNYLPAYALHTIIEESCEESERDSQSGTPTDKAVASKLERYFSWDIIKGSCEEISKQKQDDESTIYSDSLSESSNSVITDEEKDVDPTHLVSSRLEKYFTSGLIDDHHCFYPDDVEFADDVPVSDFEEDSVHQKISRSALLSSLETSPNIPTQNQSSCQEINLDSSKVCEISNSDKIDNSGSVLGNVSSNKNELSLINLCSTRNVIPISDNQEQVSHIQTDIEEVKSSEIQTLFGTAETTLNEKNKVPFPVTAAVEKVSTNKPLVNKEQVACDIQSIIKRLLSYISESGSESLKTNIEKNYMSAWHVLETEIERLLQSMSPNALRNSSCNSSTIDSNNSDYGSDTIESVDCITDDDDNVDNKSHISAKCHLADMLNSAYKCQSELNAVHISEETLSIWRRLIESLQKDNCDLSLNKSCDPNTEARLYVRDQIVTLMNTLTVGENLHNIEKLFPTDQSENALVEKTCSDELNEAYNMNLSNTNFLPNDELLTDEIIICKDNPINSVLTTNKEINVLNSSEEFHETGKHSVEELSSANRIKESVDSSIEHSALIEETNSGENFELCDDDTTRDSKSKCVAHKKGSGRDKDMKFSVFVDIELSETNDPASQIKLEDSKGSPILSLPQKSPSLKSLELSMSESSHNEDKSKMCSLSPEACESTAPSHREKPSRDTGYYSFKSSDDSLLNDSNQCAEGFEVPNFKSLKRSVKKFPLSSSTLSRSTNNILQVFASPDGRFNTMQSKAKKSKTSENPSNSPRFSSLFSPSAVLKRLTGSRSNDTQNGEQVIPPKYLKKYARSTSVESDNLFGAISMPHLNASPKPGDSYSALGLYSENDRDSSLVLDEETDTGRYFSSSQSALSLGARSVSMSSVYSGGACHYGYVTVSGDVLFGLNYNQKSQMMEVFVKQCRNLAAVDIRHNKSNPYVKVYLLPDKTRSGKRKTKTRKNTLNPIFNELLRFPVLKNELESRTLWMSVWNSDLFGRNDFLGEISLPLGYRLLDSPTLRWYPLQEKAECVPSPLRYRGELFLALKYVPRDLSLESRFRPAPVISDRGALHVLVKEARNIAPSGTLDAFCKSYLLPDRSKGGKQKTPVVRRSGHPKWYYTLIYEDLSPDELRERSLEITLWDHRIAGNNDLVGAVRLNVGNGLYHGVPVEWMDSRREESTLWLSMLDSPNMWVDGCLMLRRAV